MTQQREFPMLIPVKLETNLIANRPYLTVLMMSTSPPTQDQ